MKNWIVKIKGKAGEYTGWVNGLYYFSMYDGSVIPLSELKAIKELGVDILNQLKKIQTVESL